MTGYWVTGYWVTGYWVTGYWAAGYWELATASPPTRQVRLVASTLARMGTWTNHTIAGHTCEAYLPDDAPEGATETTLTAVIYLHDRRSVSLRDNHHFEQLFNQHNLRVLCPQTGESWWADRVHREFDPEQTAERYVLDELMPWLAEHWNVAPPQVALLGCEMGGQGALRLAYKHPNVFPVVAAIGPAIDFQFYLERSPGDPPDRALQAMYGEVEIGRQDTATLHIHPLNWPRNQWFCADPRDYYWHDSAERLRMKLYSLGVPYEGDFETTVETVEQAVEHTGWPYYQRMAQPAVEFIVERLAQEQRRVV